MFSATRVDPNSVPMDYYDGRRDCEMIDESNSQPEQKVYGDASREMKTFPETPGGYDTGGGPNSLTTNAVE